MATFRCLYCGGELRMRPCQFYCNQKLSLYGIKFTVKALCRKGLADWLTQCYFMLRCWRERNWEPPVLVAMTESKRKKKSFVVRNMKVEVIFATLLRTKWLRISLSFISQDIVYVLMMISPSFSQLRPNWMRETFVHFVVCNGWVVLMAIANVDYDDNSMVVPWCNWTSKTVRGVTNELWQHPPWTVAVLL